MRWTVVQETILAVSLGCVVLAVGDAVARKSGVRAADTAEVRAESRAEAPVGVSSEREGPVQLRAVPTQIAFQGFLRNPGGVPVTGNVLLNVVLWDAPSAGNNLWSETHPGVVVTDGVFEIVLGESTPLDPADFDGSKPLWLEVTVGAGAPLPRTQLLSSPFAIHAQEADHALSADVAVADDGDWTVSGSDVYRISGNVGIGESAPDAKLDVTAFSSVSVDVTASALPGQSGTSEMRLLESPGGAENGAILRLEGQTNQLHVLGTDAISGETAPQLVVDIPTGFVGVGTDTPQSQLHVSSPGPAELLLEADSDGVGVGDHAQITLTEDGGTTEARIGYLDATNVLTVDNGASGIHLATAGVTRLAVTSNGHVGIGTAAPSGALEVVGTTTTDALVVNGTISTTGAITTTDRVGIGTSTPTSALEVVGTAAVDVLQVNGADLAEPFSVSRSAAPGPGAVLAIDPAFPGGLRVADRPYDRTVAGVVSGANGIRPGIMLRQDGTLADGDVSVALSGRVYCLADASFGAIAPGDLLTTSSTPGHAMKAVDHERARGAVIGKAMTPLERGRGHVLVLVTLQ